MEEGFTYASYPRRIAAAIYDLAVIALFFTALLFLGVVPFVNWLEREHFGAAYLFVKYLGFAFYFFFCLVTSLYFVLLNKSGYRTMGKKCCGIAVANQSGKFITLKQSLLRFSPYLLFLTINVLNVFYYQIFPELSEGRHHMYSSYLEIILLASFLIWITISVIFMRRDSQNRTLHDFLAKTVVIKV